MLTIRRRTNVSRRLGGLVAWGLVLAAGLAGAPARAGTLERELLSQAPEVLKYLRQHHYRRVGVLKFRVQKEDGQTTDNAGPINLNFAGRLETALVLKYDLLRDRDLTLLHDASATAAGLRGASHLTPEGRARLFDGEYRALWGSQKFVRADAFLTGRIDFSPDLHTLTVNVSAFGPDTPVETVAVFRAGMGLNTLVEAGESFNLRTALTKKHTLKEAPLTDGELLADAAQEAKKATSKLDESLVGLKILYNGQPVRPEVKGGQLLVPEPAQGQQVSFVLTRNDPDPKARYGVVLMVNGVNTLFEERLPLLQCTKWIIDPGSPPIAVRGFQVNDKALDPFVVRSPAESKANEVNYGADVGTFSFSIFREQPGPAPDAGNDDLDGNPREEAAVLKPLDPPADLPKDAGPVKGLAEREAEGRLGLVEKSGIQLGSQVRHVSFKNPVLVSTVTVRYYRPQR